jgi:hypothetical protein
MSQKSTNSSVLTIVLFTLVLLMAGYILFWPGDDTEYKLAEQRSQQIIDSIRTAYDNLENRYDSISEREIQLTHEIDSIAGLDSAIVGRTAERQTIYDTIYVTIDTIGRSGRYCVAAEYLTTFECE